MFNVFNFKVNSGDYYIDSKTETVGYVEDSGANFICDLEKIDFVEYTGKQINLYTEPGVINLTETGPEGIDRIVKREANAK